MWLFINHHAIFVHSHLKKKNLPVLVKMLGTVCVKGAETDSQHLLLKRTGSQYHMPKITASAIFSPAFAKDLFAGCGGPFLS